MNKQLRPEEEEEEEDDYRESEDEDYNPDVVDEDASDGDTNDEDRKLDSAYSRYQGTGGLIKTRSQRRAEAEGRIPKAGGDNEPKASIKGQTSVDVDALWEEMNSSSTSKTLQRHAGTQKNTESQSVTGLSEEYITINRTFKFAGEVKTETKTVLRDSAEGQDYLRELKHKQEKQENEQKAVSEKEASEEQDSASGNQQDLNGPESKLRSRGRAPVKRKMSLIQEYQMNKAKKINTLEKSRLDWLGFVDQEGIRDDLSKHNKDGYLDRQSFLERVDQKLDSDIRQQRAKRMQ